MYDLTHIRISGVAGHSILQRAWLAVFLSLTPLLFASTTSAASTIAEPVGSVNVQRASLTRSSAAQTRTAKLMQYMKSKKISIVTLAEFESSQKTTISRTLGTLYGLVAAGGRMSTGMLYDGIIYDKSKWSVVKTGSFTSWAKLKSDASVKKVRAPYVVLKHKKTAKLVAVFSFHPPADTGGSQSIWRERARRSLISAASSIQKSYRGVAVLAGGDFNTKSAGACRQMIGGGFRNVINTSTTNCRVLAERLRIDQMYVKGYGTSASGYFWDRGVSRLTDHGGMVRATFIDK